jgi:hypothetical protein
MLDLESECSNGNGRYVVSVFWSFYCTDASELAVVLKMLFTAKRCKTRRWSNVFAAVNGCKSLLCMIDNARHEFRQ